MKFKIDENLPVEFAAVLRGAGHDALSVWDEDLSGRPDADIAGVCKEEERALMSLDLDFCDVRQYPPSEFPGLVVFRVRRQDKGRLISTLYRTLGLLSPERLCGTLWIVEETRIRIRS